MKKFTKSLLFIVLAIIPMTFFGQEEAPTNYWFVGIEGGATQLFGDNDQFKFDQTSWNAGLYFGYTIRNSVYMYGNLGYSNLKGENKDFFTIDECNLFHANLSIGYDVLQLFKLNPHRKVGIVPHWGFGVMEHKTTAKLENGGEIKTGYSDAGKGTGIGGRRHVFQNAFGLNFIFNFTKRFQANIDFVGYKTDSDYLDAIGGARHNKHNDWYAHANIGLAYKFHHKEKKPCPDCPPCEPDQDAIDKAIQDAIEQYKADNPCQEPEPEVEEVFEKIWEEKDIHLTFKVNNAEVEDTDANKEEAKKIIVDLEEGRDIHTIKTIGYASPEGDAEKNQKLSEDRAQATSDFIEKELGDMAEGITFDAEGRGSDWDGFYKALEASEIENKAEIAETIRNAEDKEATLNQMRAQYPELNEILNGLRVTRIYINK